jgi:hypothetical protein
MRLALEPGLCACAAALTLAAACHVPPPTTPLDRPPLDPPTVDEPARAHTLARPDPKLPGPPPVAPPQIDDPLTDHVCADDPRIACAVHRPEVSPHLLGLAVRGRTIAVAWVTSGNSWLQSRAVMGTGAAHIAWFDADLRPRGQTRLDVAANALDIDLVATSDAWVVAVQTERGVELQRLADDATLAGPSTTLPAAATPGLATTPAGDVLVVHAAIRSDRYAHFATFVDRRGRVAWEREVFTEAVEPNFGGQVYTDGGGFLVGRRENAGVAVVRLEADGRLTARRDVATSTEYPALAWCGGEGRLVWTDFEALKIRTAAIDRRGDASGPEHVLGGTPEHFNHSPVLCDRAGAIVLLGGYTGSTGLSNRIDLARVDRERGALPGAIPVLAAGGHTAYDPRLARLDARRVAVAWISLNATQTQSQLALAVVETSQEARGPLRAEPR